MRLSVPPIRIPAQWQRALPVFMLLLFGLLLLYRATGLAMVEIWDRSETFAHAFVVPPITLWLIWRKRAELALLTPRAAPVFLLPMAGFALLWLIGDLAIVNAAMQFGLTGMLVLLVPTVLGWPVARAIAFPLGFLFFAVPFGEFAMPMLMQWTAHFTVAALRLSGIPVYQEGLQFVIPSGNWSVVEACSGIRYLMASVMVGTLFAYLNYRSIKRRWIFVGVAFLLPLVANWLRAYMIVMLGHLSSNTIATGADHLVYGWAFFGVIMLVMFMVGARWAEPDAPEPVAIRQPRAVAAPGRAWPTVAALALLLLAPLLLVERMNSPTGVDLAARSGPDIAAAGWLPGTVPGASFKPNFESPAAELQASYERDGKGVGLYVGYYRNQRVDSKLISSNNMLVLSKDKVWTRAVGDTVQDDQGRTLRTAELRSAALGDEFDGGRLRVWQIYWVNGHLTASDWQAKLYGLLGRLLGQGDAAAVLVMYTPKSVAGADDALLAAFWRDNRDKLDAWLRQMDRAPEAQLATKINEQGNSR